MKLLVAAALAVVLVPHHAGRGVVLGWYADGTRITQEAHDGTSLVVYMGHDPAAAVRQADALGTHLILQPTPEAVAAYAHSPALFAWYLVDEPERNNVSPAALAAQYAALKRSDPAHPVFVTFANDGCRSALRYRHGFDILAYDEYPYYADFADTPLRNVLAHYRSCVHIA